MNKYLYAYVALGNWRISQEFYSDDTDFFNKTGLSESTIFKRLDWSMITI